MTAGHALTSAEGPVGLIHSCIEEPVGLMHSCRTVHTVGAYTHPHNLNTCRTRLVNWFIWETVYHHPELISDLSRRTPPPTPSTPDSPFLDLSFDLVIDCSVSKIIYNLLSDHSPQSLPLPHPVQFSSVQSCPTLCDSMDCSTPGFPVLSPTPRVYS